MPQVLKDSVKQAIVNAAVREFLKKGYDNTSMRNIAAKAGVTVGNVYRYFSGKEELNLYIIGDTLKKINETVSHLTDGELSIKEEPTASIRIPHNMEERMDQLSDEMADLYRSNPNAFKVLLLSSELTKQITSWFADILIRVIPNDSALKAADNFAIFEAYASALFYGIRQIFFSEYDDPSELTKTLKLFFKGLLPIFVTGTKA